MSLSSFLRIRARSLENWRDEENLTGWLCRRGSSWRRESYHRRSRRQAGSLSQQGGYAAMRGGKLVLRHHLASACALRKGREVGGALISCSWSRHCCHPFCRRSCRQSRLGNVRFRVQLREVGKSWSTSLGRRPIVVGKGREWFYHAGGGRAVMGRFFFPTSNYVRVMHVNIFFVR